MKAKVLFSVFTWFLLAATGLCIPKSKEEAQKIEDSLKWVTSGEIPISNSIAVIRLKDGFSYLNPADAKKVLTDLWGNPPMTTQGMIFPPDKSYGVIIEGFDDAGYIKDDDADKIEPDKLLKQNQDEQKEANDERKKQGFGELEVLGWATPPHYDKTTKKLYYALELKEVGVPRHDVNYRIRILGRRGYLVINALGSMDQIKNIEAATPQILSMIEFKEGHRYADFDEKKGDKLATISIAGLIAGGIAAKMGLFKVIGIFLLKFWKLLAIAVVGVGAWLKKFFGARSEPKA